MRCGSASGAQIERVRKADFDLRAHEAVNTFRGRVQGYEQVLRAVSGLFASSRKVERSDFRPLYAT